jgi:hypothetical protein
LNKDPGSTFQHLFSGKKGHLGRWWGFPPRKMGQSIQGGIVSHDSSWLLGGSPYLIRKM